MARVDALLVTSDSDCPAPDAIQAEVRELTTPEQRAGVPADAKVMVSDRGATVSVAITRDGKTTVRVYRDGARDCARRAHFVSVLTVVALMPPELGGEEVAEPPSDEPPPAPAPVASPPRPMERLPSPPRVRIELAARGDVSVPISDTVRLALPSAYLGVALGAGDLRFTLGTGFAPQTEARYTSDSAGSVDVSRFDVALGARYVVAHTPFDVSVDAGLMLARQELSGLSAVRPLRDASLSAGGRLGLHIAWSERSLMSPFLGAYASVFPFAPAISQLPQGTVGHLPYLWLGLSGGLALAL